MSAKITVTREQIDAILKEAEGARLPAAILKLQRGVSLVTLKASWPKVRGYVLAAINLLQWLHRGDAAAALAQFVGLIDVIAGGQFRFTTD